MDSLTPEELLERRREIARNGGDPRSYDPKADKKRRSEMMLEALSKAETEDEKIAILAEIKDFMSSAEDLQDSVKQKKEEELNAWKANQLQEFEEVNAIYKALHPDDETYDEEGFKSLYTSPETQGFAQNWGRSVRTANAAHLKASKTASQLEELAKEREDLTSTNSKLTDQLTKIRAEYNHLRNNSAQQVGAMPRSQVPPMQAGGYSENISGSPMGSQQSEMVANSRKRQRTNQYDGEDQLDSVSAVMQCFGGEQRIQRFTGRGLREVEDYVDPGVLKVASSFAQPGEDYSFFNNNVYSGGAAPGIGISKTKMSELAEFFKGSGNSSHGNSPF